MISTSRSSRWAAMSWIHYAGLWPKRAARVVLMTMAILSLLMAASIHGYRL
jgi:hypothetical protein